MPVRFSQTGGAAGLFRRIRAKLSAGRFRRAVVSAVILPRTAACFDGRLELQLPADFRVRVHETDKTVFAGSKSGLRLTVMRMPFQAPLFRLKAEELAAAFPQSGGALPVLQRGFLRRSPTLTASWESAVLYLIQVRGTLYLLLMTEITAQNREAVLPVFASARVRPEANQKP
ncbi:MAG: hypothetical protein J6Z45_00250 [Oscillospiraceae bacterium]|nr:hypothetical protein [Oscillospiraceae bacterium]